MVFYAAVICKEFEKRHIAVERVDSFCTLIQFYESEVPEIRLIIVKATTKVYIFFEKSIFMSSTQRGCLSKLSRGLCQIIRLIC